MKIYTKLVVNFATSKSFSQKYDFPTQQHSTYFYVSWLREEEWGMRWQESVQNCITGSFMICTLRQVKLE
jgi:hypothetical protein